MSDYAFFLKDHKSLWSADILLCMAREKPEQRLMKGTSVFEILEVSACFYQIDPVLALFVLFLIPTFSHISPYGCENY